MQTSPSVTSPERRDRALAKQIIGAFEENDLPVDPFTPVRDHIIRSHSEWVPAVLRYNSIPAKMLLEVCNLNNDLDRRLLQTRTYRQHVAEAVVQGLLAYYDETKRYTDGLGYSLQSYDLEAQHSFSIGQRQKFVWGAGFRLYQDQEQEGGAPLFLPTSSTQMLVGSSPMPCAPKSWNTYCPATCARLIMTRMSAATMAQPPAQPVRGPNAREAQVNVVPQSGSALLSSLYPMDVRSIGTKANSATMGAPSPTATTMSPSVAARL